MRSRTLRNSLAAAFALASASAPEAALAQFFSGFPETPGTAAAGSAWGNCGYGVYRAPNGNCDIVKDPNSDCQAGFHSVPASRGGFRCVQNGY
ncbi:MAG TPA: hypothetical protein VKS78_12835 [Roseiarcus sp.]|nr:hypothetical protein [Roseiarcus sp.]